MRRIWLCLVVVLAGIVAPCHLQAQSDVRVGYTILTPTAGATAPIGSALFSYTNSDGVLISEAGVSASSAIRSGRIFVDDAKTQTGIALVNPSSQVATITLTLRDSSGAELAKQPLTLQPQVHIARYVSELFAGVQNQGGSLTFESDQALAAITLRESRNAQGEQLYSTLPVADLNAPPNNQPLVFPQIAVGGGYTTQLVLINRSSQTLRGRVNLTASTGGPLLARVDNTSVADLSYQIPPHGTYRRDLSGLSDVSVGFAAVTPDADNASPAGSAIFQFRSPTGSLVSEAGVGSAAATGAARIFVDYGNTQTGVAVANPGNTAAVVTFTLIDRFGAVAATQLQTIPAGQHLARFVHELFPSVSNGYSGLLDIRGATAVSLVTLKLTTNKRGDAVLTTLPVADFAGPPTATSLIFPQIALNGGWTTRLILINTDAVRTAGGQLEFFESNGNAMTLPMGGNTASQFSFRIAEGSGRQLYPGNAARASSISLLDPSSGNTTNELVVNVGNSVRPRLQVIDSDQVVRNDFDPAITSIDSSVAVVDPATGMIQGKKLGFATLTIKSGDTLRAVTAVVVQVDAGAAGFETTAVIQDLARRLYLVSATDQVVLRAEDIKQSPQVYAGIRGSKGLKDDVRAAALFNGPSFIALNQSDGSLYVSDLVNHVVRKVQPGSSGKVQTLAASFNNPQGVALDNRGNLWVADSGDHTIRRINLTTGAAETIAGLAGSRGTADGRGAVARFNSPAGIAIESETAVQELQRQRTGAPPPPVTVLVADTGNGLIRRVRENGDVDTIRDTIRASSLTSGATQDGPIPLAFAAPAAVAVDSAGNIYVSEPEAGRVRVILQTREVVSAAQAGTFTDPRGMAIAQDGKVVVAGKDRPARELAYGQPEIVSITPNAVSNSGGQKIIIKGNNFGPDSLVVIGANIISDRIINDTQTITFTTPVLGSGRTTVTVSNRGGTAQASLIVNAATLKDLPAGYVTTVAGGSTYAGEGTRATTAAIQPFGVAFDAAGNVVIADEYNRKIRRVDGRTGILTTIAGNGQGNSNPGNGGPAIAAGFSYPGAVAFEPSGNLLVGDSGIRRINAVTGIISVVVPNTYGFCGDGGSALNACVNLVAGIAVDADGTIFFADRFNLRIRRVDAKTNTITTIAGNGTAGYSGDNGDARNARMYDPVGVAVDSARKILYIADQNGWVRAVNLATNVITTVAGGGSPTSGIGDGGPATAAVLGPNTLAVDSDGNLLISDRGHSRIRQLDFATGTIKTVAGSDGIGSEGDGGLATAATLQDPFGVAVDAAGNIVIADYYAAVVRRVDAITHVITTLAGTRQLTAIGDGGPAIASTLRTPTAIAIDGAGNLFITDINNFRVRKVDAASGNINTVIGGGSENGDGSDARLIAIQPTGRVAIDRFGNLYVAERYGYRVRKVAAGTNVVSTVAGIGHDESSGDGGLATSAGVLPDEVAVDRTGNLYIAENTTHRIRKAAPNGNITTVVSGLGNYLRIAIDRNDNLFISDFDNGRVQKLDAVTQTVSTVAGGGDVKLAPVGIDVDAAGNLFILDYTYPIAILKVNLATGVMSTVVSFINGDQSGELGDNGPITSAKVYGPIDVIVDAQGNIYFADASADRVRAFRGP